MMVESVTIGKLCDGIIFKVVPGVIIIVSAKAMDVIFSMFCFVDIFSKYDNRVVTIKVNTGTCKQMKL